MCERYITFMSPNTNDIQVEWPKHNWELLKGIPVNRNTSTVFAYL